MPNLSKEKIYLAADHAGFKMKEELKKRLLDNEYEVEDLGAHELKEDDDYPDFAIPLGKKVAAGGGRGILICGNAVGVCIAANKIKGIRAAIGYNTSVAKTSRTDDNANVLCLAGRVLSLDFAKAIVDHWLRTPFSNEPRHVRRLKKIEQLEK